MLIEGTEVRVYAESADEALTITDEIRTEKQLTAVLLTGNYPKPARGNSIRYIHRQIRTTTDTVMFNGFIVSSVEFEVTRGLIRYKIVAADAIRAFRKAVVTTAVERGHAKGHLPGHPGRSRYCQPRSDRPSRPGGRGH